MDEYEKAQYRGLLLRKYIDSFPDRGPAHLVTVTVDTSTANVEVLVRDYDTGLVLHRAAHRGAHPLENFMPRLDTILREMGRRP